MKLALGTVQFGMNYGVSNTSGKTTLAEVAAILAQANKLGIAFLDTAKAYGDAEAVLGTVLAECDAPFRIVTKVPPINGRGFVRQSVVESLQALGASSVDSVLLHRAEDLLEHDKNAIYAELQQLKAEGKTQRIGVSVYSPSVLRAVVEQFDVDIIQAPMNVFDQRLVDSGCLALLVEKNIALHVRSAFLQGLALMPLADVPAYLQPFQSLLAQFHQLCHERKLSPLQACLDYLNAFPAIEAVVVGVNNGQQLQQLVQASSQLPQLDWSALSCADERLINPSLWGKA